MPSEQRQRFITEHLAVVEFDPDHAGIYVLDDDDTAAWNDWGLVPRHPDPQVWVEPVPWNLAGRLVVRWHRRPDQQTADQ
jgi:hypothetical protein